MPKSEDFPLRKHTLNLYEGDYDALRDLHPDLDPAVVIRRVIRAHINRLQTVTTPREKPKDMEIKL